ncbi:MAG: 4a-hydroxytetrahydrobiopterin dehydratase [Deltaproteobacteria bacterium]|nr:4a-hydroxytetrahydrobiopterin dehydratase [Deltaproteobacteria bacterium]MBN2672033.1 4a-hydroxytetrahydrobiopterin dehydratase [Deltaproteobacteria bacterium]
MTEHIKQTCANCNEHAPQAARVSILGFRSRHPEWKIVEEHGARKLRKEFRFGVFDGAITFAEQLLYMARTEGHHPVIRMERNTKTVFVTWWTKEINDIHNRDLLLARQTDRLFDNRTVRVLLDA